jgi:hypothetical protein
MTIFIALVGRSRAGKDTVADAIVRAHDGARIVRLSSAVKRAACELFGLADEDVDGPAKELPHPMLTGTPRDAVVWLTDVCREKFGDDFFSKRVFSREEGGGGIVVMPDVRYSPDVEETWRKGGLVIKVVRPSGGTAHIWESGIDAIVGDVTLVNDGTRTDLESLAVAAVAKFCQTQM